MIKSCLCIHMGNNNQRTVQKNRTIAIKENRSQILHVEHESKWKGLFAVNIWTTYVSPCLQSSTWPESPRPEMIFQNCNKPAKLATANGLLGLQPNYRNWKISLLVHSWTWRALPEIEQQIIYPVLGPGNQRPSQPASEYSKSTELPELHWMSKTAAEFFNGISAESLEL